MVIRKEGDVVVISWRCNFNVMMIMLEAIARVAFYWECGSIDISKNIYSLKIYLGREK